MSLQTEVINIVHERIIIMLQCQRHVSEKASARDKFQFYRTIKYVKTVLFHVATSGFQVTSKAKEWSEDSEMFNFSGVFHGLFVLFYHC